MKALLLSLFALTAIQAQTTGQICWQPDKTQPAKAACMDVPPAAKKAVADWMATQVEGTPPTPKYAGAADLLFTHIRSLIDVAIAAFPTNGIATDRATAATALASAESKQTALLPRAKVADPQ